MSIVIHKSLIVAEHKEERDNIEENEAGKMDEGRRKKTGANEESLASRPATAQKLVSEGDESREATEDEDKKNEKALEKELRNLNLSTVDTRMQR